MTSPYRFTAPSRPACKDPPARTEPSKADATGAGAGAGLTTRCRPASLDARSRRRSPPGSPSRPAAGSGSPLAATAWCERYLLRRASDRSGTFIRSGTSTAAIWLHSGSMRPVLGTAATVVPSETKPIDRDVQITVVVGDRVVGSAPQAGQRAEAGQPRVDDRHGRQVSVPQRGCDQARRGRRDAPAFLVGRDSQLDAQSIETPAGLLPALINYCRNLAMQRPEWLPGKVHYMPSSGQPLVPSAA